MSSSDSSESVAVLCRRWGTEDRELEAYINELRYWMHEVSQLGTPHFGETANRLVLLRRRLVGHFLREDELIAELGTTFPPKSPEFEAVQRQSPRDHERRLSLLDDLINRLIQPEPPFESWQRAVKDVEMFVSLVEQHEDQESDNIRSLLHNP